MDTITGRLSNSAVIVPDFIVNITIIVYSSYWIIDRDPSSYHHQNSSYNSISSSITTSFSFGKDYLYHTCLLYFAFLFMNESINQSCEAKSIIYVRYLSGIELG
mmetsp:Transcript_66437/g.74429  ORF Transcript_66437/g.74429 Transcript_66437/m.74429 type:complete len:104 (-) Transcript_66437:30-341(-)